MSGEMNTEELPCLAFVPVGAGVHLDGRRNSWLRARHAALERHAQVPAKIADLVHHLEAVFLGPIDAAAPRVKGEAQRLQRGEGLRALLRGYADEELAVVLFDLF